MTTIEAVEQCFYVWISVLFVDRYAPTKEVRKKIASKSNEKALSLEDTHNVS